MFHHVKLTFFTLYVYDVLYNTITCRCCDSVIITQAYISLKLKKFLMKKLFDVFNVKKR